MEQDRGPTRGEDATLGEPGLRFAEHPTGVLLSQLTYLLCHPKNELLSREERHEKVKTELYVESLLGNKLITIRNIMSEDASKAILQSLGKNSFGNISENDLRRDIRDLGYTEIEFGAGMNELYHHGLIGVTKLDSPGEEKLILLYPPIRLAVRIEAAGGTIRGDHVGECVAYLNEEWVLAEKKF